MGTAHQFIGSGKKENRNEYDYYPTPPLVTQSLLDREEFPGTVWEPACGEYHMVNVIRDAGYKCYATDIQEDYGKVDFTEVTELPVPEIKSMITNPPFSIATDFWNKCIELEFEKYAMLARVQFLEGAKRYHLYQSHPPKKVYVFSDRMNINHKGLEDPFGGMLCFIWLVWEKGYQGLPEIDWISPKQDKKTNTLF